MFILLLIFHIISALFLILTVLLQSGKAGDLASAFGGASSQTAFGARRASDFLSKATTTAAIIFMATSLGLSLLYSEDVGQGSVLDDVPAAQSESPQPTGQQGTPPPAQDGTPQPAQSPPG